MDKKQALLLAISDLRDDSELAGYWLGCAQTDPVNNAAQEAQNRANHYIISRREKWAKVMNLLAEVE